MCVKDDAKIECYIRTKQKYTLKNYDNNLNYYTLTRFSNIDSMISKYYFRISVLYMILLLYLMQVHNG